MLRRPADRDRALAPVQQIAVLQIAAELAAERVPTGRGADLLRGGRRGRGEDRQRIDAEREADPEDRGVRGEQEQQLLHALFHRSAKETLHKQSCRGPGMTRPRSERVSA